MHTHTQIHACAQCTTNRLYPLNEIAPDLQIRKQQTIAFKRFVFILSLVRILNAENEQFSLSISIMKLRFLRTKKKQYSSIQRHSDEQKSNKFS